MHSYVTKPVHAYYEDILSLVLINNFLQASACW